MLENIIFDLGAVVLEWKPAAIAERFTADVQLQEKLVSGVFTHQDWLDMDRGVLSEDDVVDRVVERLQLPVVSVRELFTITRESLQVIPETERLIEEAYNAGLNLYCLSNMSVENYAYLQPRFDFFERFQGIVISGHEHLIKPDPNIFTLILERYSLNPASTLFIDDSAQNVAAAENRGIEAVQFFGTPACYERISTRIQTI